MNASCDHAREWLAGRGVGLTGPPAEASAIHAAHVASCPGCGALLRRYQAWAEECRSACRYEPDAEVELRFLDAVAESGEDSPMLDRMKEELVHTPAQSAEQAFLRAARKQHQARVAQVHGRTRRWGPILATAAAAALIVTVLHQLSPEPASEPGQQLTVAADSADDAIPIASHSGEVRLDGQPMLVDRTPVMRAGASIVTGEASHVQLGDGADAVVTVTPTSQLEVVVWRPEHTRLRLRAGTVRAKVARRASRERFEVWTPNARVIVVGTEFTVEYTTRGDTVVVGTSGKVRVERKDGGLVGFVTAGGQLRVEAQPVSIAERSEAPPPEAIADEPSRPVVKPPAPEEPSPAPAEPARETVAASVDAPAPARPTARTGRAPAPAPDRAETRKPDEPASATEAPVAREPAPPPMNPLQQARKWLSEGEEDKAIALLLEGGGTDWRRDALLGDAYQLSGEYQAAERAYRRAVDRAARPPAPLLADLATVQGKHLRRVEDAAKTWRRYLAVHPRGSDAAQAHLAVGRRALREGGEDEAETHFRAIIERSPRSRQVTAALTLLGRQLLKERRWADAESLFAPRADKGGGQRAEVSLVGMIRVRIGQGRAGDAGRLILSYRKRFPDGQRRHEVQRLEDALTGP